MSYKSIKKHMVEIKENMLSEITDLEERARLEAKWGEVEKKYSKPDININIDPSLFFYLGLLSIPAALLAFLAFCIWIGYKAAGVL